MIEPVSVTRPKPFEPQPPERRAFVRLSSDLPAICRPTDRTHEVGWPARIRDISRGGVGLILRHRFRPGTNLTVELGASTGALLRTARVHVVHATAVVIEGCPCWILGCAFDQVLTEEELQSLGT